MKRTLEKKLKYEKIRILNINKKEIPLIQPQNVAFQIILLSADFYYIDLRYHAIDKSSVAKQWHITQRIYLFYYFFRGVFFSFSHHDSPITHLIAYYQICIILMHTSVFDGNMGSVGGQRNQ